jgi:hypothetical protein
VGHIFTPRGFAHHRAYPFPYLNRTHFFNEFLILVKKETALLSMIEDKLDKAE